MRAVVPIETVEDRVQTDAVERNTFVDRDPALSGDLVEPCCATDSIVAGLGHNHGPPIALVYFLEQQIQWTPPRIIRSGVPMELAAARHLPLVGSVIVHANDVKVTLGAAQLG